MDFKFTEVRYALNRETKVERELNAIVGSRARIICSEQ